MTESTMTEKRYIARNKKTGLFLSRNGLGFNEANKESSPKLGETELLVVRYQWQNVVWERC